MRPKIEIRLRTDLRLVSRDGSPYLHRCHQKPGSGEGGSGAQVSGTALLDAAHRGRIYWYKFTFNGEAIRESTRQKNHVVARNMESAHRTSLAKGEVASAKRRRFRLSRTSSLSASNPGPRPLPTPKTWLDYYRPGIRKIQEYKPLANLRLSAITSERVADFAAWRQSAGLQISSVNLPSSSSPCVAARSRVGSR